MLGEKTREEIQKMRQ